MTRRWFLPTGLLTAGLLAASVTMSGALTSAQDTASPEASPTAMMSHPAHIHAGTCATLGEVVFPLTDVMAPDMSGTPMAEMDMATPAADMGDTAEVVAESTTTVGASLADIIGGGHAINIHESAENIQNYIACGDITGTGTETELTIELNELNASGYEGMAMLTDNGDDTTTVVVMLTMVEAGAGTPVASPTA